MTTQRDRLAAVLHESICVGVLRHETGDPPADGQDYRWADALLARGVRVSDPFPSPGAKVQVDRIAAAVKAMFDAWIGNERAHAGQFLYERGVRVLGPADHADLGTTRVVDRYLGDPPADFDEPGAAIAHYTDACDTIRWLLDERTRLLDADLRETASAESEGRR